MGIVREDITLTNVSDENKVLDGSLNESQVRSITVNSVVDTGAITLVINEEICKKLGLRIESTRYATLANGEQALCKVTEPVRVKWKNRDCAVQAYIAAQKNNVLLGAIPLEYMDLIVDPVKQQLTGAHGEEIVSYLL